MRRQDREDPATTKAKGAAQAGLLNRLVKGSMASDRAAYRRAKAKLPPEQYEAFIGAARLTQAKVLAGLEVVGFSASKKSRKLVAAGIDSELAIIAGVRAGAGQQSADLSGPDETDAFAFDEETGEVFPDEQ